MIIINTIEDINEFAIESNRTDVSRLEGFLEEGPFSFFKESGELLAHYYKKDGVLYHQDMEGIKRNMSFMREQERISEWLTVGGNESPDEPSYPNDEKFNLSMGLILEELFEGVESNTSDVAISFYENVIEKCQNNINRLKENTNDEKNMMELRDAISDLRVVLGNLIHFSGMKEQYYKDLDDVMTSNFSKFCKTEKEAEMSVEAYANGTHPNKMGVNIDTYYHKQGDYFIVRRKSDNKILKSIKFEDVVLI